MSNKNNQSSDNKQKLNEGLQGISKLNPNHIAKDLEGISNLNPTNSDRSGNGELRTNGFDGIFNIAPKPQRGSQEAGTIH